MLFIRKHILLVLILLFPFRGKSQFAIAGTPDVFYTDIVPDTVLSGIYNGPSESFSLDINNDGIYDVRFNCGSGGGLGGQDYSITVASLHSYIRLSLGGIDSTPHNSFCGGGGYFIRPVLRIYSQLDIIQPQNFVQATSAYIGYHSVSCGAWATSNQWVGLGDRYIGVSYFNSVTSTTYYGWIRVSVTSSSSCIVRDYSLFAPTSIQINEFDKDLFFIKAFPNPSNEGFNCVLRENSEEGIFKLCDITGKEIQVDFTIQEEGKYYFETKNIVDGIYFLEIESNNEIVRKKIIVQH